MSWLGEWLREIILVVLLASFVEMLLPSKSMERYARLVLSLLVLLTMLSPIISLLKGDAVNELSLAMDQQKKQDGVLTSAGQGANTLEKILAEGQKLANGRQEQGLKLAASEIAEQMKDQITAETGHKGVQVTVSMAMNQSVKPDGEALPAISLVTVTITKATGINSSDESLVPGATIEGGTTSSGPIVISPVNTVEVNIGNKESEVGAEGADESAVAIEEVEVIMTLLEQKWGLKPEVIKVQSSIVEAARL